MPSAEMVQAVTGFQPVAWATQPSGRAQSPLISPSSIEAVGDECVGMTGSTTWSNGSYPASSRVLAFPFVIVEPYIVMKVWAMSATTGGTDSFDVGVYTEDGATLLVHGGSTLKSTANSLQEVDCTDTLLPVGRYWCAYVQGGVTATNWVIAPGTAMLRAMGFAQQAGSGSTLGSTFTPAAIAGTNFPIFGIANRTAVA